MRVSSRVGNSMPTLALRRLLLYIVLDGADDILAVLSNDSDCGTLLTNWALRSLVDAVKGEGVARVYPIVLTGSEPLRKP